MVSNSKLLFELVFLDFWFILEQFWVKFKPKMAGANLEEPMLNAFPSPKVDSKGRLDPTWGPRSDFEAISKPKIVQTLMKNQLKIDVCIRLRFLINLCIKNLCYMKASN